MLSLTLTIHSYIICLFFAIAYIYDGVLYECTRRFHRVFLPTNNLGNPSYKMSKTRFFQVGFLCSVTLNLTFTFKYVILLTLAFVSRCFDLHIVAMAFSETLLNQTKNCEQIDKNRHNLTFGYRRISDLELHIYIVSPV